VTDKNGCTDDTLYTGFMVSPTPVSAFTITENIDGMQGKIRLNNLSQGMMEKGWKWDYETGQTTASSPVVTYTDDSKVYTIELVTWNEAGCYDTTKLTYDFIFDNLFVPNAFSPDSYILELREFKPKGRNLQDYKLMVFNKWGHLIFETNKLDEDGRPVEGWDGKFKGEPLPQDVYVWKIQATFKNNKVWQGSDSGTGAIGTTGTVTLIR
jgi:gliding motility-associated-like protein